MKRQKTINKEVMQAVNRYLTYAKYHDTLDKCYKTPSTAKIAIFSGCRANAFELGCGKYGISFYNTCFFSFIAMNEDVTRIYIETPSSRILYFFVEGHWDYSTSVNFYRGEYVSDTTGEVHTF